jgi:hypothetical protein
VLAALGVQVYEYGALPPLTNAVADPAVQVDVTAVVIVNPPAVQTLQLVLQYKPSVTML